MEFPLAAAARNLTDAAASSRPKNMWLVNEEMKQLF